jgi:zinc protease
MVQAEMLMLSKGNVFTKSLLPESSLFNEYFGSGLSSIVFQEIREAKALAYSAYCYFSRPNKTTESHYVQAYIGTQADKQKEAVDAMLELMNNMPEAEKQFEDAKLSAMKVIETERITKTSIFWSYESAKDLGFDYDFRKDIYNRMQTMKINDLKSFFEQNIKGKKYNYLVVGKKSDMDLKALKPLGEYEELSLEKIFGY